MRRAQDFLNRRVFPDAMIREIKAAPRAKSADRILLPGEMEWERQEVARREGLCLPDDVLVNLVGLAEDVGLVRELEAVFQP